MNENKVEGSFLELYDIFLKLNLYIQKTYKKDGTIKNHLKSMSLTFEDLAEHYYWKEIRRVNDSKKSESH